jgi:hypothetical protein
MRLFLMRWFKFSVSQFEKSCNPRNGAVVVMTRRPCDDLSEASLVQRVMLDDEFVYKELFTLNEEAYEEINVPRSISEPKTVAGARSDLEVMLAEARQGYDITSKTGTASYHIGSGYSE